MRLVKLTTLVLLNLSLLSLLLYGFEAYLKLSDPFLSLPFDSYYYNLNKMYYPALIPPEIPPDGDRFSWGQLIVTNKYKLREREFDTPKPADVCRIMVLGDSFILGMGLAEAERYTNLVESYLNTTFPARKFEVFNLGWSGASTIGQSLNMRDFKDLLTPDLVVLGFVLNDPQPKSQDYTLEKEQFEQKYGDLLDSTLAKMVQVGLPQTAKLTRKAIDNLLITAGVIPAWEVGMQRVYDQDSAEWQAFEQALRDIKAMSDELKLPTPFFVVLNQDIFWPQPTASYTVAETLPIYLRWYHQAEKTAAGIGFRTYNHEKELLEQLTPAEIPLNALDYHPSAKVHQLYADKLLAVLAADMTAGKLCYEAARYGATPVTVTPLAAKRLLSVKFGESIRFWGYTMAHNSAEIQTGSEIQFTFGWQALTEIEQNYAIKIEIVDEAGTIWAEHDTIPCQGRCPTTLWPAGVIAPPGATVIHWPEGEMMIPKLLAEFPEQARFQDLHRIPLPPEVPPGEYRLLMSLYEVETSQTLPAYDEIAQTGLSNNKIILGTLTQP